jgi:hypothetical protein
MRLRTKVGSTATALVLVWSAMGSLLAQQQQPPVQSGARVRVSTEVVLVNVVARDKHGNLIKDLKNEDFTVYEDGKKQDLVSFDFEHVDELAMAGGAGTTVSGTAGPGQLLSSGQQKSLE